MSYTPPKPANSHVRIARCKGLASTWVKVSPRSRSQRLQAFRSPCFVNGRSVSPCAGRQGPGGLAVPGQINDWKPVDHDPSLEWPLPAGLFRPVDAVLVGVVTAGDLTVEQRLADVSRRCPEAGHSVDGV